MHEFAIKRMSDNFLILFALNSWFKIKICEDIYARKRQWKNKIIKLSIKDLVKMNEYKIWVIKEPERIVISIILSIFWTSFIGILSMSARSKLDIYITDEKR